MNWIILLLAGLAFAVLFLLKRKSFVPEAMARKFLREGALVVDVRRQDEFKAGHLPGAVNIPLDELGKSLPRQVADKNRVLLLHCQVGVRSGIARRQLLGMGYTNAFN